MVVVLLDPEPSEEHSAGKAQASAVPHPSRFLELRFAPWRPLCCAHEIAIGPGVKERPNGRHHETEAQAAQRLSTLLTAIALLVRRRHATNPDEEAEDTKRRDPRFHERIDERQSRQAKAEPAHDHPGEGSRAFVR